MKKQLEGVLFLSIMFFSLTCWSFAQATVDNAAFVSQSVPATISSGQTVNVSVVMTNNGTTTWATNTAGLTAYLLSSQNPLGNTSLGINLVSLPQQPVAPGQTVTFSFQIIAPQVNASTVYNFQWQMVRQTVGVSNPFGALTPNVPITVFPAGSINITGTVTDALSHMPIANAQVSVEIDGGFASSNATTPISIQSQLIPSLSPFIWGQSVIVNTDINGNYTTMLQTPNFIPPAFMYAKILVATTGQPLYGSQVGTVSLSSASAASGALPTYTLNFSLSSSSYGAFVSGVIQDAPTSDYIPAGDVFIVCGTGQYNYLPVDNHGEFFGVIPLSSSTQTCTVTLSGTNPGYSGFVNGISYQTYSQSVQLTSGGSAQLNIELLRNQTQTAIEGVLTDAVTGQPVPYAEVTLVQQEGVVNYSYLQTNTTTDIFGHYVLPVATAYPATLNYLLLSTYGGIVLNQYQSPYNLQQVNLSNNIVAGDITVENISLSKNPSYSSNTCAAVPSNATACPGPGPSTNDAPYQIVGNSPYNCAGAACTAVCNTGYISNASGTACVTAGTCAALPSNATACPGTPAPATNGAVYTIVSTCANTACTATCNSGYTLSGGSCIAAGLPAAPTGLGAVAGSSQVVLSWNASANATFYSVGRSTTNGGPNYSLISGSIANTSYTDTSVSNGTTYYYVVYAGNDPSGNLSLPSAQVSATPQAPVPAAPTNLTATIDQNSFMVLNWSSSPLATGYNVYRSYTKGGPYTLIGGSISPQYDDFSTTIGTTYYYVVTAKDAAGESGYSNEASAIYAVAPNPPTNITAIPGNNQVSLSWIPTATATSYSVYRSTTNGGPYTVIAGSLTTTSYSDTTALNNTTYYYVLTATNAYGQSAYSYQVSATPGPVCNATIACSTKNQLGEFCRDMENAGYAWTPPINCTASNEGVTYSCGGTSGKCVCAGPSCNWWALPLAPTGLSATAEIGQVALTWQSSAGATLYNLERSTINGGPYNIFFPMTKTSYTDTSVNNGTTYYYVVTAGNAAGTSMISSQASALPQAPALPAPINFIASTGNEQVILTWGAITGATSYNVERSTVSGGPYILIGSALPPATTFTDTPVRNGTTYYYVVIALNASGQSSNSLQVSATPNPVCDATVSCGITNGSGEYCRDMEGAGYFWTPPIYCTGYTAGETYSCGGTSGICACVGSSCGWT